MSVGPSQVPLPLPLLNTIFCEVYILCKGADSVALVILCRSWPTPTKLTTASSEGQIETDGSRVKERHLGRVQVGGVRHGSGVVTVVSVFDDGVEELGEYLQVHRMDLNMKYNKGTDKHSLFADAITF